MRSELLIGQLFIESDFQHPLDFLDWHPGDGEFVLFACVIQENKPLKQPDSEVRILPEVLFILRELLQSVGGTLKMAESCCIPLHVDLKDFQEGHQSAGTHLTFGAHHGILSIGGNCMANHLKAPAKNPTGDFGQFTNFVRRLVAVPHSEIKAKLDAEKRAKKRKKVSSRASHARD